MSKRTMLIRLTPTKAIGVPVEIEMDMGKPIAPGSNRQCLHDMKYRLVRSYDLTTIDPEGVAINYCDYCGTDLNRGDGS
jgi:hypothetical protein